MVIISTRAIEVSIQAVSPEFGVHFSRILTPSQAGGDGGAAAAAGAGAGVAAEPQPVREPSRPAAPWCLALALQRELPVPAAGSVPGARPAG